MSDAKVTLEINGHRVQAAPGSMIIQAADEAGILIPRFCYHHKLSIAANCRMCMVEVEKAPKPLPACATPVSDGMKVFTESELARDAQQGTMEFLLINHPLDCPICDQGGECELQDLAVGYGEDASRYTEAKRVVLDKDIGPLVATEMTRCIQCTRCVRFGEEIAGVRELGATGRGEHMEIGTYIEKSLVSELSGNVIDLCPVGALTAKPSRYTYRPWELRQVLSVAPHDCVGSNVSLHLRNGALTRVVPHDNESINECWISDRDRFSYEGIQVERCEQPMIKQADGWRSVDWQTALNAMHKQFSDYAPEDIAVFMSPNATLEEHYLAQRYFRGIGVSTLEHRLRQMDYSHQDDTALFPWLGLGFDEIPKQDSILLVGFDARRGAPILGHRIREATKQGASVSSINLRDHDLRFSQLEQVLVAPKEMVEVLAAVTKFILAEKHAEIPQPLAPLLETLEVSDVAARIATSLLQAEDAWILLGQIAQQHPEYAALSALASAIAAAGGVKLGFASDGANAAGAWLAGTVPHRGTAGEAVKAVGKNLAECLEQPPKAAFLFGIEPRFDFYDAAAATAMFEASEFVVMASSFVNDDIRAQADVILPIASAFETSGTFVNGAAQWQSFQGAVAPPGEARPGWKIFRVLGNVADLDCFDYTHSREVRDELKAQLETIESFSSLSNINGRYVRAKYDEIGLQRISDIALYSSDALVRRAASLQATPIVRDEGLRLNSREVEKYGLAAVQRVRVTQGSAVVEMPLIVDDSIPANCAYVATGTVYSSALGAAFGPIKVEKV